MANLFKKPVTRTDPKTGKRVKGKSKKWWGRYRDATGRERRVPLATDKTAAQTMLNEKVRQAEREAAGQADPYEDQGKRSLKEHIGDFEEHLRDKENSEQHVSERWADLEIPIAGADLPLFQGRPPSSGEEATRAPTRSRRGNGVGMYAQEDRPQHGKPRR